MRASNREEKNRESKRKYTVRRRAMNEKKKRIFFIQVVSLCIVISILYSKIIRNLSYNFFPSKRKGFHINLCVIV